MEGWSLFVIQSFLEIYFLYICVAIVYSILFVSFKYLKLFGGVFKGHPEILLEKDHGKDFT